MKGLILVAHPDDEILFAGGLLLSYPSVSWTLACLTLNRRSALFPNAAEEFRYRGAYVSRVEQLTVPDDHYPVDPLSWILEAERQVARLIKRIGSQDFVFTHNRGGDYGHPHHIALSMIVRSAYHETAASVWEFWNPVPSGSGVQPHQEIGVQVSNHAKEKLAIFRTVYGVGVEEELRANQPELMAHCLDGDCERFTSERGTFPR